MAESQRRGQVSDADNELAQTRKERMFLLTFFLGGIALVAGMFWIADGLSENFKATTPTFLVMAIAGGLAAVNAITSRIRFRD
jgi:hypothetical protein